MNKGFKQFIKDSREVRLHEQDRIAMRNHYVSLLGLDANTAKPRSVWRVLLISHRHAAIAFGAIVLTIATTSGVALAAEGAIPGDTLYPIKIHVTEEMRGVMARTPKSKAQWETERVERRLHEAEKVIIKKSKTHPQALQSIQANIASHAQQIQKSIDAMERGGEMKAAAQASSNIEAPLIAHKKILRELQKKEKGAERLLKAIEDEEKFVGSRRKNLEARIEQTLEKKPSRENQDDNDVFRIKERSRREDRQEKVLLKAKAELNVSIPHDDAENDDEKDR